MLNIAYSLHHNNYGKNLAKISFYNFSMPVILIPLKLMSSSLVLINDISNFACVLIFSIVNGFKHELDGSIPDGVSVNASIKTVNASKLDW